MPRPTVQFLFGNGKLLDLLEDRASALKDGEFDKAAKVEVKMTEYKNANLDELMRPQKAVVIF